MKVGHGDFVLICRVFIHESWPVRMSWEYSGQCSIRVFLLGAADDDEEPEESADEEPEDSDDEKMEGEETAQQEERRRSHGEAGPENGGRDTKFYAETPDGTKFSAGAFSDLHLSRPLLKACAALGYTDPTPIQVP